MEPPQTDAEAPLDPFLMGRGGKAAPLVPPLRCLGGNVGQRLRGESEAGLAQGVRLTYLRWLSTGSPLTSLGFWGLHRRPGWYPGDEGESGLPGRGLSEAGLE